VTTIISSPAVISVRPPTALSILAASMGRGTWAQMNPTPRGLEIFSGGPASGVKPGYATKMARDPVSGKIFAFVGDHNDPQILHFCEYDEVTNTWTDRGTPPGANVPDFHGWEHSTWDSANRKLYRRPYGTRSLRRWDGGSSWATIDYSAQFGYNASITAIEWFPERNEIVVAQPENDPYGKVAGYNPNTNAWTTHSAALNGLASPIGTGLFAQYSPHKKLVWFGGGTLSWTLNASGSITSRAAAPYGLGPTNGRGLMVCNPLNGNFITMLNANSWHDFDPVANTWTARSGQAQVLASPNATSSWPAFGVIAVPIFELSVIAFVKCYDGSGGVQMWLFKP
jgi:hypothetical protein